MCPLRVSKDQWNVGLLLFPLLFLSSILAWGQTPPSKEWSFHAGSFANNGVRPGVSLGVEFGIFDKVNMVTKVKPGKGGQNYTKVNQLILGSNLAFSWIPRTSLTVLNSYIIEYRRTTKKRMQYQIGLGPGIARSVLPNVYEVKSNGDVRKLQLAGRTYAAPYSYIGYGRYRKGAHALQWWHVRISNTIFMNYNAFVLPFIATEIRLGFHKKPFER